MCCTAEFCGQWTLVLIYEAIVFFSVARKVIKREQAGFPLPQLAIHACVHHFNHSNSVAQTHLATFAGGMCLGIVWLLNAGRCVCGCIYTSSTKATGIMFESDAKDG